MLLSKPQIWMGRILMLSILTYQIEQPSICIPNINDHYAQAHAAQLYGPRIQWILPNWLDQAWWANATQCTSEEFLQVIEGAIYTGWPTAFETNESTCLFLIRRDVV
jgi:hypothetical protein